MAAIPIPQYPPQARPAVFASRPENTRNMFFVVWDTGVVFLVAGLSDLTSCMASKAVYVLSFGLHRRYISQIQDIRDHWRLNTGGFPLRMERFVSDVNRECKEVIVASSVFYAGAIGLLALVPQGKAFTRLTGYLILATSFWSFVFAHLAPRRLSLFLDTADIDVSSSNSWLLDDNRNIETVSFILTSPSIWLAWSTFNIPICLFAFFWENKRPDNIDEVDASSIAVYGKVFSSAIVLLGAVEFAWIYRYTRYRNASSSAAP